jgi:hypothetical protein
MAFWIEEDFSDDVNDIFKVRAMNAEMAVPYAADDDSDIYSLPRYNGKNQGSSCLTLTGNFYKLGTNPAVGINGWRKL